MINPASIRACSFRSSIISIKSSSSLSKVSSSCTRNVNEFTCLSNSLDIDAFDLFEYCFLGSVLKSIRDFDNHFSKLVLGPHFHKLKILLHIFSIFGFLYRDRSMGNFCNLLKMNSSLSHLFLRI